MNGVPVPTGSTRWRRAALVLTPAYAAVAAILVLAGSGVLGVSFAVSGTPLTVTAGSLTSGEADVGIMSYPPSSRGLSIVSLRDEPMAFVCHPGHRLARR